MVHLHRRVYTPLSLRATQKLRSAAATDRDRFCPGWERDTLCARQNKVNQPEEPVLMVNAVLSFLPNRTLVSTNIGSIAGRLNDTLSLLRSGS